MFGKEEFLEKMKSAKHIEVLGCNPVAELFTSVEFFVHLRQFIERRFSEDKKGKSLFSIYAESEQEDFCQKLLDSRGSANFKLSYIEKKGLIFGEEQANYKSALVAEIINRIVRKAEDDYKSVNKQLLEFAEKNIIVKQLNLRMPFNCIKIDDEIWFSPLGLNVPELNHYIWLDKNDERLGMIHLEVDKYLDFLQTSDEDSEKKKYKPQMGGAKFLSMPGDELIDAYDELTDKRVAVFSRKAFLTKEYKRGSIWGFIFNRKGEVLLHKRSSTTPDNTNLWDKSTGGHIDLTDASTTDTAKRELVEEVFIKDSEFSNYSDTKMYMVIDFGEWRKALRQNTTFIEAFRPFTGNDKHIIMFRAFVEKEKKSLTIDRPSIRKYNIAKKGESAIIEDKPTWFKSDVFFYIAAEGQFDTNEQMEKTLYDIENKDGENKGAASEHRLISIDELKKEVAAEPAKFTDDMVFMLNQYWSYLVEFSAFVKEIFDKIKKV